MQHTSLVLLIVSITLAGATGALSQDASGVDLAAVSLSSATPVWSAYTKIEPRTTRAVGGARIVPPHPIAVGKFATANFPAGSVDWAGHDRLALEVDCLEAGELVMLVTQRGPETQESFQVRVLLEQPGARSVDVRLEAVPKGDLEPTAVVDDGVWNPGEQDEVQLILLAYPAGFAIDGMRLERADDKEVR